MNLHSRSLETPKKHCLRRNYLRYCHVLPIFHYIHLCPPWNHPWLNHEIRTVLNRKQNQLNQMMHIGQLDADLNKNISSLFPQGNFSSTCACPACAASATGEAPVRSQPLWSAPAFSRAETKGSTPEALAMCNAVWPLSQVVWRRNLRRLHRSSGNYGNCRRH